ncbi:orexin receptor type 2-like [Actinia tenebrosa]|uniref:Orexin receptor type 2-like n=1 Tax=Actinia tenebrosa TaxID=6105 RepID=A0A6P8JA89_ACTTE|nr:orexin receptor type 2-like [Actinia tenebrosa]XP_031573736.1 orexin receptor type 2-like [Actinia tenebrosa]
MTVRNYTNVTNASLPSQGYTEQNPALLRYSSVERIACYSIIYGFISLLALVGNILVCFVIIKNPRMRTVTNVFLLNLALADILFIMVTVPGVMNIEIIPSYWVFGELLCKIVPFINTVTLSTSIYTMVVLAIDRYYAVLHPFRAKLQHTVRRTSCLIALIWVISVMVASPQIPSRVLIRYPHLTNMIVCGQDWSKLGGQLGHQIYSVAIFLIFFAVPITIISFAYSAIIARLRKTDGALRETFRSSQGRANKDGQPEQEGSSAVSRKNRKTTFMMLTVIIVFLICMLPLNVFILVIIFPSEQMSNASEEISDANSVLTVFAIASSACNPIIYNFFSLKFRRAFADAFRCECKYKRVMRNNMTSEFNTL